MRGSSSCAPTVELHTPGAGGGFQGALRRVRGELDARGVAEDAVRVSLHALTDAVRDVGRALADDALEGFA